MSYVSQRAKITDDVGACLRLVMISGNIVLAALAFVNMAITGVVNYKSKDPRVHRGEVTLPDGVKGPLCLITTVYEALFSNVNYLELFEMVRDQGFRAAGSWLAFRRSRDIDWSRCRMDTQFSQISEATVPPKSIQ